jgi:hypothetical protein
MNMQKLLYLKYILRHIDWLNYYIIEKQNGMFPIKVLASQAPIKTLIQLTHTDPYIKLESGPLKSDVLTWKIVGKRQAVVVTRHFNYVILLLCNTNHNVYSLWSMESIKLLLMHELWINTSQ